MSKDELFKNKLIVNSPTSISIGYTTWTNLDTKLVGRVKAMIEENKQLKDNWNKLKDCWKKQQEKYLYYKDNRYRRFLSENLELMQELEKSDNY